MPSDVTILELTMLRYKLVAMKLCSPSKEHLEKHYADLSDKPFFKGLVTCESMRGHAALPSD